MSAFMCMYPYMCIHIYIYIYTHLWFGEVVLSLDLFFLPLFEVQVEVTVQGAGFSLGTAPLSNSCIISIIWLYIALKRTPVIDCYWVGAVPKV